MSTHSASKRPFKERLNRALRFKPDIALSKDESSRFLPWIIALMVYMAAMTLSGSFTLHHSINTSHQKEVRSFSVHVPKDAKADDVIKALESTPGVESIERIPSDRLMQMVEPWFGKSMDATVLPLPVVLDAVRTEDGKLDIAALEEKLQKIAPSTTVDDHKQWMAEFSRVVELLQWLLFVIAGFIMLATAAVVIFASKTSLKIHRATVSLLHRLGAFDRYIAAQFEWHASQITLKGAFIGSGFAAGSLLLLHITTRHIESPLFPSLSLTYAHWAILLLLPIFMTYVARLAARGSVLRALRRMP